MNIMPEIQLNQKNSEPEISGKIGALTTRLAKSKQEVKIAQNVRYQVFCEEMSAKINMQRALTRRDRDAHDKLCDHLLVLDTEHHYEKIVGTQRFFVKSFHDNPGTFYSQSEFDLEALINRFPDKKFMELGRSCILPEYRDKRTMELMWHGTWSYALQKKADVMIGCASFEAEQFDKIAPCLGFLGEYARCDPEWDTIAIGANPMELAQFKSELSPKRALASLPPLIKGYLRLGAKFASHAVPDPDFGTIDVLVILPVASINPRYVKYYGADAEKHRT